MERFIGKMLDGRYEIKEIIGVGGMAVVFKAKCHRLNRYVAIKILKDEYMGLHGNVVNEHVDEVMNQVIFDLLANSFKKDIEKC